MNNKLENIFSLKGKVIVITGATGLLGRKHAEAIACYGGTPILLDLSQQIIDDFANKLNDKYKVDSVGFAIDITDEKAIEDNIKLLINSDYIIFWFFFNSCFLNLFFMNQF